MAKGGWRTIAGVVWAATVLLWLGHGLQLLDTTVEDDRHADPSDQLPLSGRWVTSDRWLRMLGAPEPSETVRAALADLPADEAILLVGPADVDWFGQTYYVLSYLLWPRRVWGVACGRPGEPAQWLVGPSDAPRLRHALLASDPPLGPSPDGRAVTRSLAIVPLAETAAWTSFCPR